jgi:pimeloyl-ACP methyl ester carboxylesterase
VSLPVVLIPGAGGQAWVWHLVEADLRRRGYDAFAVDLPAADESKGLPAYADAVVSAVRDRAVRDRAVRDRAVRDRAVRDQAVRDQAVGDRTDGGQAPVTIAAYSLGAFTAPLVWQRVPARQVIFVNAMIPRPGETPGAWWDNVGWERARTTAARRNGYSPDFDLDTYFLHDIPADLRQQMLGHDVAQSPGPFGDKCLFDEWPGIPLHVIAGRDDRFFPVELQQRVARERLGVEPDVVPGGHLAALSRPAELAAALARYL